MTEGVIIRLEMRRCEPERKKVAVKRRGDGKKKERERMRGRQRER